MKYIARSLLKNLIKVEIDICVNKYSSGTRPCFCVLLGANKLPGYLHYLQR